ncbi:MAG: hypothetical protein KatS3mg082_1781 [Nitrospiraceae bacterium]|nr:MAG: hypothetical protein KatS3mg082_1781 [Nitrospiraceae bacterium]
MRIVYDPDERERDLLADLLPAIKHAQELWCGNWVHAFRPGRSPVTNAAAHIGRDYTLSMDLSDFFDSVSRGHLIRFLPTDLLREVDDGGILYRGAPRQGLPTSPAACNLAALPMDWTIIEYLETINLPQAVYTRYADDLTISWSGDRNWAERLKGAIPRIAEAHGFRIARHKTRLQSARAGRRVICGVAVDNALHPTRSVRRRLRAAEHHWARTEGAARLAAVLKGEQPPKRKDGLGNKSMNGLRAWCRFVERAA